jgi:hypothetical protein
MPRTSLNARRVLSAALAACAAAGGLTWWALHDPVPYELHGSPQVTVAVSAARSQYPDARALADEAELLLKAYVQRLAARDAEGLAELGAPWFKGRGPAAHGLVARYGGEVATAPVEVLVADPVATHLAAAELRFSDGRMQRMELSRADGIWYLQLGTGDPVAP